MFLLENFGLLTNYAMIQKPLYNYRIVDKSLSHSTQISPKKISSLDADRSISSLTSSKFKCLYEFSYINSYYKYYSHIHLDDRNAFKNEYYGNVDKFYQHLMKSDMISNKDKLKILMKVKFDGLFVAYKTIKDKNLGQKVGWKYGTDFCHYSNIS